MFSQDVDAVFGRRDLPALLLGCILGDLLHAGVDAQAQQRAQNLHTPVAVGVQEQAVGILPNEGDRAERIAVHTQQPLDLHLSQLHGGVALVGPGTGLLVKTLEGQRAASALRAGADNAVLLAAHVEGEGDRAALRTVAHPSADVLFAGVLIETVGDRVHKQGRLADAVLTVYHSHAHRRKIEFRLGVAAVVLDLDLVRNEGSRMLPIVPAIVRLLDDWLCQGFEPVGLVAGDVVVLQPAAQGLKRAVVLGELIFRVQFLHVLRDDLGNVERAVRGQRLLDVGPV